MFEKREFVKYEFLKMWFLLKNETLKMWILSKMTISKCEFCENYYVQNMNFWTNQDFCPSVGFKLTDTFYCCLAWKPRALIGTERMDWGSNWHDSTPGGHRPCTRPVEAEVIHLWLSRWDLKIGLLLKSDFEVGPISAEDWVALKMYSTFNAN